MKHQFLPTVHEYYPRAMTTEDAVNRLLDIIEERYGLLPHQLMHADSICCDDVNTIQYPPRAYEMLGPFKLGGLDGYPFAGLTGMAAFAQHVPENGAVVIYFAPHIGVSKEGDLGVINRYGQSEDSTCCGAAQAAVQKLLNNEITPGHVEDIDYQMHTLEQILLRHKERIEGAGNRIHEATEVIYQAIEKQINLLIEKTHFPCRYVFLIGSVFINSDHDIGSFCTYKRFECLDLKTGERRSLLGEFYKRY